MSKRSNGKTNGNSYELMSDVPLPNRKGEGGIYPFEGMKIDKTKMFWLKPNDKPSIVRAASCMWSRNQPGRRMKFTVRLDREKNQFGCWRVK